MDHVFSDVIEVTLDEPIEMVRRRLDTTNSDLAIVTTNEGIVLGRVRRSQLGTHQDGTAVEEVMEAGPTTVRADEEVQALSERMRHKHVNDIAVTRPDGTLLGIYSPVPTE